MKHKITLRCDMDGLYKALTSPLIESYEEVKKKTPSEDELKHGLTFQTRVTTDTKNKRYATVKVLKYDRPHQFKTEYRSDTYHKITTFVLEDAGNEHTSLTYELIEEKIRNGTVVQTRGNENPDKTGSVPLLERRKYLRLAEAIRKNKI